MSRTIVASFLSFLFLSFLFFVFLSLPLLPAEAQDFGGNRPDTGGNQPSVSLKNPIKYGDLRGLVIAVLDIIITLGTYVAVIFIIWSGFLFVKAQGNEQELSKAKTTFFYTIIGVAILLGAKAIALALEGTIGNLLR